MEVVLQWWRSLRPQGEFKKGYQQALNDLLAIRLRMIKMHDPERADFRAGYELALKEMALAVTASNLDAGVFEHKTISQLSMIARDGTAIYSEGANFHG